MEAEGKYVEPANGQKVETKYQEAPGAINGPGLKTAKRWEVQRDDEDGSRSSQNDLQGGSGGGGGGGG